MNKAAKYIIIFCVSLLSFPSLASFEYSNNIEKAHQELLELNYTKANNYLELEKTSNPNNKYINYLFAYQSFLKTYFNVNKSNYDKYIELSENTLELLEHEGNNETALLLASTISIQRAFIFFLWGEHMSYVKALMHGQSFLDDIDKNTKNPEYLKTRSIYEVLGGSIPNKFKPFAKWFNIKGSAKKGIQLIERYLRQNKLSSANLYEGQMIKLYLRSFLDIPNQNINPASPTLLTYVYLQTSKESAKKKIIRIDNLNAKSNSYFVFLKAKYLIELQKEEGFILMNNFIQNQNNQAFLHSAHYYLAWYFCAQGNKEAYKNEISKINLLPSPTYPTDKKALERTKQTCNSSLIKSRMLFDAGEYKMALKILKQKSILNDLVTFEEKIEYLYRLARVYENLENTSKALELYQKVIDTKKSDLYFVSFSAYRTGKIYALQNQKAKALEYYNIALELNDGEYKKSIEQKCQYSISSIK